MSKHFEICVFYCYLVESQHFSDLEWRFVWFVIETLSENSKNQSKIRKTEWWLSETRPKYYKVDKKTVVESMILYGKQLFWFLLY